ncbi:MAG: hypothetical protein F6K04_20990, partial [Leptolyngbya sp. SIO4C5]|nr:hypothetical protein [Leptolyngbya sp. SIO4C5]
MRLGIYSTINGLAWGASEQLWSQAALVLQAQGHQLGVNYPWYPDCLERLAELQAQGGTIFWRQRPVGGVAEKVRFFFYKVLLTLERQHDRWLLQFAPDFVLISVSYHTEDVSIAKACLRHNIPFAILLHCASPIDWITHFQGIIYNLCLRQLCRQQR